MNVSIQHSIRLMLLAAVATALVAMPSLSRAKPQATITVANTANRSIAHIYTSPVDRNEWTADQLPEGSHVASGESVTLGNVICEGDQVKVIAEDKDGCFMYAVVSCQEASTWTINSTTPRDCGN